MAIKNLGDYIPGGKHEFIAFVKNEGSPNSSKYNTIGNKLGKIHFGVLVCERQLESKRDKENDKVKFFYKDNPVYDGDSNISYRDFSYDAKVISEVPLSLSTGFFYSGQHLKKKSKEFREAKKLLNSHGIY